MVASDLDPLLSDRTRLRIMAILSSAEEAMEFSAIVEALELTRGNLSSHMRKLEDEGYVKVQKEFVGRKPRTSFLCTSRGKKRVKEYLESIEQLLKGLK
jgi:DNA-binding transcriptional ArsR family regulator